MTKVVEVLDTVTGTKSHEEYKNFQIKEGGKTHFSNVLTSISNDIDSFGDTIDPVKLKIILHAIVNSMKKS